MQNQIRQMINSHLGEFERYCAMLVEWNEKFNLTAITDRDEIFVKHFADSVLGEEFVPQNASVLDVGTGAGFPSLPIKIVRPDVKLTLNDSLLKRIGFLDAVISELKLSGVKTVHARAEDLTEREGYDVVVARAVAPLSVLAEYCLPFVKVGGVFVAYKADDCGEEVDSAANAIKTLGGAKAKIIKKALDEQTTRSFVLIEKERETPKKYPRGKNLPRKSPL